MRLVSSVGVLLEKFHQAFPGGSVLRPQREYLPPHLFGPGHVLLRLIHLQEGVQELGSARPALISFLEVSLGRLEMGGISGRDERLPVKQTQHQEVLAEAHAPSGFRNRSIVFFDVIDKRYRSVARDVAQRALGRLSHDLLLADGRRSAERLVQDHLYLPKIVLSGVRGQDGDRPQKELRFLQGQVIPVNRDRGDENRHGYRKYFSSRLFHGISGSRTRRTRKD